MDILPVGTPVKITCYADMRGKIASHPFPLTTGGVAKWAVAVELSRGVWTASDDIYISALLVCVEYIQPI